MSEIYHCWYPLQIRFRDLDPLAHVNNSVYFIYFEEARSHYFKQLEVWQKPAQEEPETAEDDASPNPRIQTGRRGHHYGTLVKEITCTYELPLVRTDLAEVGVRVVRIGRSSYVMEHQIRDIGDHERIYATGRSVMVWANYHTGRSHPLPLALRSAFEKMEERSFSDPEGHV